MSLGEIFIVFVVILALHAMINIFSSHLVALFNNISVFWHCVGVVVIIGVLIIVPDHHQSADFVFTERINNRASGWACTGSTSCRPDCCYDVHGHRLRRLGARRRGDARRGDLRGEGGLAVGRPVGADRMDLLLAITFAASDVGAVDDGGGTSSRSSERDERGWAEFVILISAVGEFFWAWPRDELLADVFAFSRDHAHARQPAVAQRQRKAGRAGGGSHRSCVLGRHPLPARAIG